MKQMIYYCWMVAISLSGCSTLNKQKQQVSDERYQQIQVLATSDSVQWNGHLGNWSFDVKAGRYRLLLDSSARQKQQSSSAQTGGRSSFFSYFKELVLAITVLLGLFWGILRWLRQTQR